MHTHRFLWLAVCSASALPLLATEPVRAQESGSTSPTDEIEAPNSETARLSRYIGAWMVTEHHFNERGEAIATVKGSEEIVWILDRHAIQRRYRTTSGDTRYVARGLLTWNAADKKYEGFWLDNVSTNGPNTISAEWNADNGSMVHSLEARGADGKTAHYKIIEEFPDTDTRIATTYAVTGAEIRKIMTVRYVRVVPCPASQSIRVIDSP